MKKRLPEQSEIRNPYEASNEEKHDEKKEKPSEHVRRLLRMQADLFEHGRRRAIESGATRVIKEDLETLLQHARAIAKDVFSAAYDPTNLVGDNLRDNEFQKLLKDRDEIEDSIRNVQIEIRKRKDDLAMVASHIDKPQKSPALQAAATAVIGLSVAPTFHDNFFSSSSDETAWLLSALCGAAIGLFLTFSILNRADEGEKRGAFNYLGLIAGIAAIAALGAFRGSSAEETSEWIMAVGLTLFEGAAIAFLELYAHGIRAGVMAWREREEKRLEAEGLLANKAQELSSLHEKLTEIEKKLADHREYVAERQEVNLTLAEVERSAETAVADGYHSGISARRGKAVGVKNERKEDYNEK